jgi:hypothetical protein
MRNGLRFGEVVIAGDAATGIIFDRYSNECEARLDGECIRSHGLAVVCARALAMNGVHLVWSFVDDRPAGFVVAPPQTPQPTNTPAPAIVPAPVAPALLAPAALPVEPLTVTERHNARHTERPARCRHYTAIKACFAVFIARGLPTDDEAMRATLGRLLGRDVPTRKALTAADWEAAASAARWLPV